MAFVIILIFLLPMCASGGVGYLIGSGKGRGTEGFWYGLLLGFIGWIIVGVMDASPEHEAASAERIAAAIHRTSGSAPPSMTRACPFCAEQIQAAAVVCRFCNRDVEPLSPEERSEREVDPVRAEFPAEYAPAKAQFDLLADPPDNAADWLRELCRRIQAGSPAEKAAAAIPLDWVTKPFWGWGSTANVKEQGRPPTWGWVPPAEDPDVVEALAASPHASAARSAMAALPTQPDAPDEWLAELCRRMEAGSPPAAAAAQIPLNWSQSDRFARGH